MLKAGRSAILLSVFFIVSLLLTVVVALSLRVPEYYSLVKNAHPTTGSVTSKERENHMSIRFEYRVGKQVFTSVGVAEDIGRTFESIQLGEVVPIVYDDTDRGFAVMGDPRRRLNSSLRGTGFGFVGLLICFLLFALRQRYRARKLDEEIK